ncbi:MAG: ABC transporter ATP-binding protein, partial [Microbacterium sp.]
MTVDSAIRSAGEPTPHDAAVEAVAAHGIDVGYLHRVVLKQVDLAIAAGGVTCLVGPNGSGKSTMLKACARLLATRAGTISLQGDLLSDLSSREVGQRLAIL